MRIFAVVVTALALAVGASSANAANFVARLHAPNHHPTAGKLWWITVSARSPSGRAMRASAYYQFLYNGQVVSKQYPNPHSLRHAPRRPYSFTGRYRDSILWPKRSIGIPLTFRVVIRVGRTTKHVDWKVKVRR